MHLVPVASCTADVDFLHVLLLMAHLIRMSKCGDNRSVFKTNQTLCLSDPVPNTNCLPRLSTMWLDSKKDGCIFSHDALLLFTSCNPFENNCLTLLNTLKPADNQFHSQTGQGRLFHHTRVVLHWFPFSLLFPVSVCWAKKCTKSLLLKWSVPRFCLKLKWPAWKHDSTAATHLCRGRLKSFLHADVTACTVAATARVPCRTDSRRTAPQHAITS